MGFRIGAILAPERNRMEAFMPVSLSIKNVPDELAERLRQRAARNHRSLQGEVMAILEAAEGTPGQTMSIQEFAEWARKSGLRTPSESVAMIREDRDNR